MAANLFITLLSAFLISCGSQSVPTGPYLRYSDLGGRAYTVAADARSWIINGRRTLLLGGSVHYPRLSPGQYKDILTKMVNDGLNHVEVYVFWNLHEPTYDFQTHRYNYKDRANLTGFLSVAKQVGLFVNLRIGPYVCAEWSFGGLPTWLLHVNGISFRDGNTQWENYMQTFVEEIASVAQPYLAKNGGPIILAQIENEYHGGGTSGSAYISWCGQLVTKLNMGVSWVMCNGESAPNTINTCNSANCIGYAQTHSSKFPGQPLGWTEDEGWFQSWATSYDPDKTSQSNRAATDWANRIALWFAMGGAHHNYYMWYGGNHVGWTAGAAITNMYADGVNLHADGLFHEPVKTHLMRLHNVLANDCNYALLESANQYGHEIPLGGTTANALSIASCNSNDKDQQWSYDANTDQLKNGNNCATSNGKSNPVPTSTCNSGNQHQKWSYSSSTKQFKSTDNTCLDVYAKTGPAIDEYACKASSASDIANQQWTVSGNSIKSVSTGQCLSVGAASSAFAYQYRSATKSANVSFLCNTAASAVSVNWKAKQFTLAGNSVSIVDNGNNLLFDTSKVNTAGLATKRTYSTVYSGSRDLRFSSFSEAVPLSANVDKRADKATANQTPLEQIRFANGSSEYLFYETTFTTANSISNGKIVINGRQANTYLVYIDSGFVGDAWDGTHAAGNKQYTVTASAAIAAGKHTLTIVSGSLGIENSIAVQKGASSQDMKGVVGAVSVGGITVTNANWNHWIGRTGDVLDIAGSGANKVSWKSPADTTKGLTWFKTSFATPTQVGNANGAMVVDIGSSGSGMKRGHFWFNGMDMGHYNNVVISSRMIQQYYFIPDDYFTPNRGTNTLLFAEESSNARPTNTNIVYTTFVVP